MGNFEQKRKNKDYSFGSAVESVLSLLRAVKTPPASKRPAEKYPKGYNDYFPDLVKYDKPDGTCFYAVTIEIPTAIYLVKIKVKTDDAEDIERWLDGDDAEDHDGNDGETIPDDNISQYSNGDDDGADAE